MNEYYASQKWYGHFTYLGYLTIPMNIYMFLMLLKTENNNK